MMGMTCSRSSPTTAPAHRSEHDVIITVHLHVHVTCIRTGLHEKGVEHISLDRVLRPVHVARLHVGEHLSSVDLVQLLRRSKLVALRELDKGFIHLNTHHCVVHLRLLLATKKTMALLLLCFERLRTCTAPAQ